MAQARDSLFGVLPTPINLPHPYAQAPEPTKAPRRPARRQQASSSSDPGTIYYAPDNTCGYVDGVKSNYFACDQGSTCVIYTSTLGVPGHIMCQIRDHYQLRTACINSSDQCDDDCASNTAKLKCTNSDAPYCNTVDFPSSVTGWMCSSRSNTVPFNAQITFSGQKGRTLSPFKLGQSQTQSQADSSSSSVISSASDISSTSKGLPTFSSKPGATEATHPAATTDAYLGGGESNNGSGNGGGSHKTNVGAIAGGAVGGVAGLALIGAGLFFFLRRKKTKTTTPVAQTEAAEKKPALYGGPEQPPAELHSGSGQYPHGAAELYSPEPVYEAPGHPVPRS